MTRLTLAIGTAAAGALALAAPALAQGMPMPAMVPADGTVLEVETVGTVSRAPDLATIRAGVVTQAANAAEAMAANSARMRAVLAALGRAGVAERDVQTATLSLSPQYRYAENQPPVITGYQASNQVTIRFRELGRAGAILDTLVREGANSIEGPELAVDKPEAALDEARVEAIRQARARAEAYARAAGLRVDRIVSITEGAGPGAPRPMMAMKLERAAADGAPPIAAGEQDLSVSVSVRFLLK